MGIWVVIVAVAVGYLLLRPKAPASVAPTDEARQLVQRVGELIVLPTDENPTIATIADPERLKGQAFFARAKVGDKVLIYTKAKKAILYDPEAHRIVEVAPVNIGAGAGTTPTPP